jgi:hypothetical protein
MAGKRAVSVGACAIGASASSQCERASSRIIDRTFRCTPVVLGDGLREIDVVPAPLGAPEYVSGPSPVPLQERVAARDRFRNRRVPEGIYVSHARRTSARESIRLSPTGLPGPPAPWWKRESCLVRRRMLVRVRALFQAPATW